MGQGGLAHPGAFVPGLDACAQALAVAGPSPAITRQNSSQSMGPWSWAWRASFHFRSGSGRVTPSTLAWSTVASMNFWRSASLEMRLMPQRMDCALLGDWSSGGPNIMMDGHHQRLTASCTMAFCASVPCCIMVSSAS